MSYSIIFETKIINLSDGRILHLDLSGCNNDDVGRTRNEFRGRIFTKDEFVEYAESFKKDRKPYSMSDGFELKIGNKLATYYDYGEHLLRMLKRAVTWEQLLKERYCYATIYDGVRFTENNVSTDLSPSEWERVANECLYGKRTGTYRVLTHAATTEDDIVKELESRDILHINFYIGRKRKIT